MQRLLGHFGSIASLTFAPDGSVISGGMDGTVRVWTLAGQRQVWTRHRGPVVRVTWDTSGALVSLGVDGQLYRGKRRQILRDFGMSADVAFAPAGPGMALAGNRGVRWHEHADDPVFAWLSSVWSSRLAIAGRGEQVAAIAVNVAEVTAWTSLGGGWQDGRSCGLSDFPSALAFSPDASLLVVSCGPRLALIDPRRMTCLTEWEGHQQRVTALAFHPSGHTLVSAAWDGTVCERDWSSGRVVQSFDWAMGRLFALAIAPDGLRLAAGSESGEIVVWDREA